MTQREKHIAKLFTAELQFGLASAVRFATTTKAQPLDLPLEWSHGQHSEKYNEVALRPDQADYAACFLHRSATFLMAVAMKDATRVVVHDPKTSADSAVRGAYQTARLIRNAFAHDPFAPTWSIDPDCRDQVFAVPEILSLDTTGLHGTPFDWRHYGGPLALLRLCQFVRLEILKDDQSKRKVVPIPAARVYQIGDLTLTRVDRIPPDAKQVDVERFPDGSVSLPGGYTTRPGRKE